MGVTPDQAKEITHLLTHRIGGKARFIELPGGVGWVILRMGQNSMAYEIGRGRTPELAWGDSLLRAALVGIPPPADRFPEGS